MKLAALLLALGLAVVMGVTMVAQAADASAQSPLNAGSSSVSAANASSNNARANLIANAMQSDPERLQSDAPRKNTKKRARNRCARITTTCWSAA